MKIPEPTIEEAAAKIKEYFSQADSYAVDSSGDCMYRTSDGKACAVGCLIPDEAYDPRWDTYGGASSYAVFNALEWRSKDLEAFLASVQGRHDRAASLHRPMETFLEEVDELESKFVKDSQ